MCWDAYASCLIQELQVLKSGHSVPLQPFDGRPLRVPECRCREFRKNLAQLEAVLHGGGMSLHDASDRLDYVRVRSQITQSHATCSRHCLDGHATLVCKAPSPVQAIQVFGCIIIDAASNTCAIPQLTESSRDVVLIRAQKRWD